MNGREGALREAGVAMGVSSVAYDSSLSIETAEFSGGFSGYGEFTPITVRSYTVQDDAHLERNKRRD
ncbi:hypothetical protein [Bradyrhizobium sp. Ash2021]|uniref:hypothetical protein n=1 Tax=Bradyrhizobium sp. Ash2021 TaxID=2954771 RepID=UPI00281525A7|nr:hypothetical protein [Bradyrhizobium sp. Ash2021]WMT75898.1 hypothetical protein NL528_05685 [Bradyrhizobium sp. Ash2021]